MINENIWKKFQDIGVEEVHERCAQESLYYPLAFEYSFRGGSDEDIARLLYENVSTMCLYLLIGTEEVEVTGSFGGKHLIRFSRLGE